MRQVASFRLTYTGWKATSLEALFPDKVLGETLVIDEQFHEELGGAFEEWGGKDEDSRPTNLRCYIFQTEEGENNDDLILQMFNVAPPEVEPASAVLEYLAGEGRRYLDIPLGQDEVHLILRYGDFSGYDEPEDYKPVLIEHEFEHGVDSIHLHAYDLNSWKADQFPMVLVIVVEK